MPQVLYCPERLPSVERGVHPETFLIFLAGPNRGAPPWRKKAIEYLLSRVPENTVICSPERKDDHSARRYSRQKKNEQMDWERDHLMEATRVWVKCGVWLFWLPLPLYLQKGSPISVRLRERFAVISDVVRSQLRNELPRVYGQRTAHELGVSAVLRGPAGGIEVVIGAEEGYCGMASTMHTFEWFLARPPVLHRTLQDTCDDALKHISRYR